jgi:surfeit locus 1 family protein
MLARLKNYRFNWKISLFTVLLLPVLIRLGFWQLEREQEKLALQNQYELRQDAEAVRLAALNSDDDLQYMPVVMSGNYDNAHNFLLDNKIFEGKAGFEVLTPFYTEHGEIVIINRGWIAQNAYRGILPQVEEIAGQIELRGAVYIPLGEQFMLGEDRPEQSWPRIIQSLDMPYMAEVLDQTDLFPYTVRLDALSPGVYVRNWPLVSTTPEKHRGYAIQWFTMASVLILLYIFVSTRPEEKEELRHGQE